MMKFNKNQLETIKFGIEREFEGFRQHFGMPNETFELFMDWQKMTANPEGYEDFMIEGTYKALLGCIENYEMYKRDGREALEKHLKDKHDALMKQLEEDSRKRQERLMRELDELIAKREKEEREEEAE